MASSVIGALRVNLGIDTAAFSDGLKTAGSKLSSFGGTLRKAVVPLAAVATAAAAGFGAMVAKTTNAADEMSKAAQKFGIPIEELSRLKYAADLSDVSLETLGTSVGRLSKNMVAAAGGAGPMADAFAAAGIAVQNADGSLRSSSDVLADLSNKFASIPDGAEKTALAMQLMGRSGAEMIPLLNGGADALAKMKAEADTFGQVFTQEMGTNAEAFNDNMTRLRGAFGAIAADLTAKLLPYLAQFSQWLVDNGPRLANVVVGFVELGAGIVHAGQAIVNFVADGIAAFQQLNADLTAKVVAIEEIIGSLPAKFAEIGRAIVDGIKQGISEKWQAFTAWVEGQINKIPLVVRKALGIASPSTVFAEIGQNIMQGLAGGLASEQDGVRGGMQTFAEDIAGQFRGILEGSVKFKEALGNVLGSVGDRLIGNALGGFGKFIGIPGFASGTNFAPGGWAMVGERGPEIVNLPRGARVTPNHELRDMGGVHVNNVYNFAPGVSPSQLRDEGERIKRDTIASIVRARQNSKAFLA
jgi:hypothetical protein